MMTPLDHAKVLTRQVRSGERDGQPTKIAVAWRSYAAEVSDVWDALTNAERLPRWFLPISGELKVGGRYQLEGNAGGLIEVCEPPQLIKATWEFDGNVSWLQVRLSAEGDQTRLELVHESPVDPEFAKQYGPGAVGVGWDLALMGLGLHLETGADKPDEDVWSGSPEGREFARYASDDWVRASIEDGTDPAEARAAGEATLAFYTTVPEQQ